MNREPRDLNVQQLTLGHSHLIEANAGTGKTYAIANLFLRFIMEGIDVRSLLVVTFAKAAADELRGRIRQRLTEARQLLTSDSVRDQEDNFFKGLLDQYPQGKKRKTALLHLDLALQSMNEASIHTIHGFCQQALTEYALSSGQSFDTEQSDDSYLMLKVMQDWWRQQTYESSVSELVAFQTTFSSFEDFQKALEPLLTAAAPELYPRPLDNGKMKILEQGLQQSFEELCASWKDQEQEVCAFLLSYKGLSRTKINNYKTELLQPVLDEIKAILNQKTFQQVHLDILRMISRDHLVNNLLKKGKPEDFILPLFGEASQFIALAEPVCQQHNIKKYSQAHQFIQQRLAQLKAQQGLLSFDDMIEHLHQALHCANEGANKLAKKLATQYPLIMVDEFQDTDPLQYAIFHRIHKVGDNHTLIMIGDPKQAIYSFRGGDIFTYMQASRDTDECWSLSTNWRSTEGIVDAVNQLFGRSNAFGYEEIPYHPSRAAPADKRKAYPLCIDGEPKPAMIIQQLPLKSDGKVLNKNQAHAHVHNSVADHISQLLAANAKLGEERLLKPGDIAVLVRTGKEAEGLRQVLLKRGIRSVTIGDERIWKTSEAESLRLLLEACALPEDRSLARQALTAPILGLSVADIYSFQSDQSLWTSWVELLYSVHEKWQRGFMGAFQYLQHGLVQMISQLSTDHTESTQHSVWLSRVQNPERMLTNLMHLAELLQQASREHPGIEALLAWMQHQQNAARVDEHLLRLESDDNLVKMTTMHSSKGLQFPVVFAPYLWHCRAVSNNTIMKWHKPEGTGFRSHLMPWLEKGHEGYFRAEHERLAEDVRLAYVALTRAESYCHVFFGQAGQKDGNATQTALAWLLSDKKTDLDKEVFSSTPAEWNFSTLTLPGKLEILPAHVPDEPGMYTVIDPDSASELSANRIDRPIRTDWRIVSFSSLTRGIHQATRIPAGTIGETFALQYPAGAHVGSFMHALLERIQPNQPLREQFERLVPYMTLKYGLKPEQDIDQLEVWLNDILHTPLDDTGLTLASIPSNRRIPELTFDFSTQQVDQQALDSLLRETVGSDVPPIPVGQFRGMVTGSIDLVFEYNGRYYLSDYKSNLLGRQLDDYLSANLTKQILARRYDLQYLLYTLALHRHLRSRLPDYNYERDFGGVYYLFLRGMTPATGASRGVFFTRPSPQLVKTLDEKIFTIPEAQPS